MRLRGVMELDKKALRTLSRKSIANEQSHMFRATSKVFACLYCSFTSKAILQGATRHDYVSANSVPRRENPCLVLCIRGRYVDNISNSTHSLAVEIIALSYVFIHNTFQGCLEPSIRLSTPKAHIAPYGRFPTLHLAILCTIAIDGLGCPD